MAIGRQAMYKNLLSKKKTKRIKHAKNVESAFASIFKCPPKKPDHCVSPSDN